MDHVAVICPVAVTIPVLSIPKIVDQDAFLQSRKFFAQDQVVDSVGFRSRTVYHAVQVCAIVPTIDIHAEIQEEIVFEKLNDICVPFDS